jgi:hypothetical protein
MNPLRIPLEIPYMPFPALELLPLTLRFKADTVLSAKQKGVSISR